MVAAGHRAGDLGGYTQRQLLLHYREATRLHLAQRAGRVVDINAGMAGGKHARELIDALTKDP